jgi:RimJ/RimL family protein N-acetyltransferase
VPAPATFRTARLEGRRPSAEYEPFLVAMWSDPAVTATLGGMRDREQVAAGLDAMVDHWERRGFGSWILFDRASDEPVGWAGLKETEVGGVDGVELLYAITSARWREGLATEAGRAVVAIARDQVGLDALVCFTLVDNEASQRTMRGLGFRGDEPVLHAGLPHVLMRLDLAREQETAGHG